MRRAFMVLAVLFPLLSAGCDHHNLARNGCSSCNAGGHRHGHGQSGHGQSGHGQSDHVARLPRGERHHGPRAGMPGPPSASVAYPYYTLRGPRDFLLSDPPGIGR